MELINNDKAFIYLVDDMIFLEEQLLKLRDSLNNSHSKNARKAYKEYLSEYINVVKTISKTSGMSNEEDESSLGEWLEEFKKNGIDSNAIHS